MDYIQQRDPKGPNRKIVSIWQKNMVGHRAERGYSLSRTGQMLQNCSFQPILAPLLGGYMKRPNTGVTLQFFL